MLLWVAGGVGLVGVGWLGGAGVGGSGVGRLSTLVRGFFFKNKEFFFFKNREEVKDLRVGKRHALI